IVRVTRRADTVAPQPLLAEARRLSGHTHQWVESADFSPDGKRIVSAGCDCTIRIWDRATGREQQPPINGHVGHVTRALFLSDNKRVLSCGEDQSVRVWDADTRAELDAFRGHEAHVRDIVLSADGKLVLSGDNSGMLRLWELATKQERWAV